MLINASGEFPRKGRPKNELTQGRDSEGGRLLPKVGKTRRACVVSCGNGGNCRSRPTISSPSRYVRSVETADTGDIQTILDELATLKKQSAALDNSLISFRCFLASLDLPVGL